jgi:hypothetical protein
MPEMTTIGLRSARARPIPHAAERSPTPPVTTSAPAPVVRPWGSAALSSLQFATQLSLVGFDLPDEAEHIVAGDAEDVLDTEFGEPVQQVMTDGVGAHRGSAFPWVLFLS